MMKNAILTVPETDLGSRHAAAKFRLRVEEHALLGEKVVIDLGAVLSISESYADELFGVIVARRGLEWLADHVVFIRTDPAVFHAIVTAIRQRLEAKAPEHPELALLAARKALSERYKAA